MRTALTLVVAIAALFGTGCHSYSECDSCHPKTECCKRWQPNCCNSWDFYVPCDMIEGRELRKGGPCDQVPTCDCK